MYWRVITSCCITPLSVSHVSRGGMEVMSKMYCCSRKPWRHSIAIVMVYLMGTRCWPGHTWRCLLAGMASCCLKHQRGRLFGLPGWRGYWAGVAASFSTTTAMCCPLDPNAFTGVIDGGPPCKTRMAFSAATTSACIAVERVKINTCILISCCLGADADCPWNDNLFCQQGDLQGTLSHSCSTFGIVMNSCHA